jgi:hypothetical protein
LFVILLLVANYYAVRTVWRHRDRITPLRGFGTAADIGRLRYDVPRVQVQELTVVGPDETRLAVRPVADPDDVGSGSDEAGLEFRVAMNERDPGYQILQDWLTDETVLGIVLPAESRLIRLRSIEGLQPLTLRRLDA